MIKIIVCTIVIAFVSIILIQPNFKNNVCKSFGDYYTIRDNNPNCYYNPDHELSVQEIIKRHGYPVETYTVTTQDGYILELFRIPHGKDVKQQDKKPRKPVFVQHGLSYNCGCFINRGKKSLGFKLANEGYDVWLGNVRGSIHSSHVSLDKSDVQFWNFTIHELAAYDLPVQLELVHRITNQKIMFIGYSMGALIMYIHGVTSPYLANQQVSTFVNLAPAVFLDQTQSLWKVMFTVWPVFQPIIGSILNGKMTVSVIPSPLKEVCVRYPFMMTLCQMLDMIFFGFNFKHHDPETLPVTFLHNTDWTSIKLFSHLVQLANTGNLTEYDYGIENNLKVYGNTFPPAYDLSKFNIPVHIMRASNDFLTTQKNVERLYNVLPNHLKSDDIYVVNSETFNHLDIMTGIDAVPLLYDHIVDYLRSR